MAQFRVKGPDGREYQVSAPENATDQEVMAMVTGQDIPKTDHSAIRAFGLGISKPIDTIASYAANLPLIGEHLGKTAANNELMRKRNDRSGYQAAGNMVGTLPTAVLPGGIGVQGAVSGGLLSDKHDLYGVTGDMAGGALTSVLGGKMLEGLGSMVAPKVSRGLQVLHDAGVTMTPGTLMANAKSGIGKMINKGEEALTSAWGPGDIINMAREGGVIDYNRALGNRVMSNIGKQLPADVEAGLGLVPYVKGEIGKAYQNLVPKLSGVFDNNFVNDLSAAKATLATTPNKIQNQFKSIIADTFMNRANGNTISGQALKDAESKLTKLYRTYSTSSDADQRMLGDAIGQARQSLRGMIERSNPQHAQELQALNKSWAQLRPMNAASSAAPDGIISPARMFQEVRKTGYDDELARAAAQYLKNSTPDSGTARRAAATTAAMMTGGGAGAVLLNPLLAGVAAARVPYSKAGMQALNSFVFAPRGPVAQAAGKALRASSRVAPALIPPLLMAR